MLEGVLMKILKYKVSEKYDIEIRIARNGFAVYINNKLRHYDLSSNYMTNGAVVSKRLDDSKRIDIIISGNFFIKCKVYLNNILLIFPVSKQWCFNRKLLK